MTTPKACCVVVAVVALPFVFQGNTGCSVDLYGTGVRTPENSFQNSYGCSCTCSPPTRHREFAVGFSEDDAEQKLSDNTVDLTSPDLDFSSARLIGVRFRIVKIPKGAHIVNATVQFSATTAGTGSLTLSIRTQAANNAPAFSGVVNNLSSRTLTVTDVPWSPPNWNAGDNGPDQRTPNLDKIIQAIVSDPMWVEGNPLVLIIRTTSGTGARHAFSMDGSSARMPVLAVDFEEPSPEMVGPQDLPVCMLAADNPNLNGGVVPSDADLISDCTGRVQTTLAGLAKACGYPADCTCSFQSTSQKFADKCDADCVENPVDANCADFDPVGGNVEATNAPGDEPVCLAHSALAQGLFGRRTRCEVSGTATVKVEDEDQQTPGASGILDFLGTPCPGAACSVGIEYRLNIDPVTFKNFFGSETFEELAGLGESIPGQEADLSIMGVGMFASGAAEVSARGRRKNDQLAFARENQDLVNVEVKFGSVMPTCKLSGSLLGSTDPELKRCEPHGPTANKICSSDADCTNDPACTGMICNCLKVGSAPIALGLDVSGQIVNQPPAADAGADQTVECTNADGTETTLDGTASSDLDDNISLYSWRRGSRTGPEVGIDPVVQVLQPLGNESYVLRTIDALGQSDEDTTMVDVTDTVRPHVHCAVAKHVLEMLSHNLVNVGLTASSVDQCEGSPPITAKVFGDEDDQLNTGDGVFSPDAKNLGVGSLRLRAERNLSGNGRVYLIVAESSDSSGNRGFDCCTVIVPHSPRLQASLQSAEKQAVAAQNFCLAHDGTAPAGYFVIGDGPVIGSKQ